MMGDGFALVKEMALELQLLTSQDPPFEEEFASMLADITAGSYDEREEYSDATISQMEAFYELLDAILIASLPCLEIRCIDTWLVDEHHYIPLNIYRHAKRRLLRTGRLVSRRCDDPSIPSLHTVIFEGIIDPDLWQFEKHSYGEVYLDPHEFLFCCALSLQQLIFSNCLAPYEWPPASTTTPANSSLWRVLPVLRSIEFDAMKWGASEGWEGPTERAISNEELDMAYLRLRHIAEQCAKLSSFKISIDFADGPHVANSFSPNRLLQSLRPMAARLEVLTIHLERVWPVPGDAALLGAGMHDFTRLQDLSLDEMCFCNHWDDNSKTESNSCLVDVLPSSVKYLNVRLRKWPRAIPDLVRLGNVAAGAADRFPSLKHVTVEAYLHRPPVSEPNRFCWADDVPSPQRSLATAEPQIQALPLQLAEAFKGSGVVTEVMGMRTRLTRSSRVVPLL